MAPAYRPHLADGCLDIRVVEATVLARSRLVAAVLTGTLGRSRVYRSWQAGSVDVRAADGQPIWLSTDGEVATAETGFTHGKIPRGLVVYRRRASSHAGHADVSEDAVCVDDGHAAGAPAVHIPYSDR
jgi:undecaprenyl-diphosphatase